MFPVFFANKRNVINGKPLPALNPSFYRKLNLLLLILHDTSIMEFLCEFSKILSNPVAFSIHPEYHTYLETISINTKDLGEVLKFIAKIIDSLDTKKGIEDMPRACESRQAYTILVVTIKTFHNFFISEDMDGSPGKDKYRQGKKKATNLISFVIF